MSSLSTIITQMTSAQTIFNAAIKNKIASLKTSLTDLSNNLGIANEPGGYVGIDALGDSTIQRDGTVNRDLFVGRNLEVSGTTTLSGTVLINGAAISGDDNSVVMAIALG